MMRSWAVLVCTFAFTAGCTPAIRSTATGPITPKQMAELWVEPDAGRDLFWGVGGKKLQPDPGAKYRVLAVKEGGFSTGLTVEDSDHRKWSAKFPPEATTEVVASRLVWGLGYHQPPIYYVGTWSADGAPDKNPQLPARFRESKPDLHGLDAKGDWSYYQNPFVGTKEMNGLLVLQVMFGNSDLKDKQNAIYTLKESFDGAKKWYVARDLGQSFGRTGTFEAPRGDIQVFEQTPFIHGMSGQYVQFEYTGRHRPLIDHMTPDDVKWICRRLKKLTDRQWQDAFRAGGYAPELADRFIQRFKQKIDEGLALQ